MSMKRAALGVLIVWLSLPIGSAAGETSAEYFPLADGNSWIYLVSKMGNTYFETSTVLPGTAMINGVTTKQLWSSDGSIDYWTNDVNGIRLHAMYDPETPAALFIFSPPMVLSSRTMDIPQTVNTSGLISIKFDDGGIFVANYTASSTAQARESLTVPAGSYNTIRLHTSLRIFLEGIFDDTETIITWVARYLGEVRSEDTFQGVTKTRELTETNIILPFTPAMPWIPLLLLD